MASLLSFRPTGILPCASYDPRRSDGHRSSKPPSASAAHWWAPIFGWQSDPDYIDGGYRPSKQPADPSTALAGSGSSAPRFTPGCFTEEKARELRKKTMEMSTFHDAMYHSAIASRLASDVPHRSSSR